MDDSFENSFEELSEEYLSERDLLMNQDLLIVIVANFNMFFNMSTTKSISVLNINIIPFNRQYLSNLLLNELTGGDSTTYPGKPFHKLVTRTVKKFFPTLVLHCL